MKRTHPLTPLDKLALLVTLTHGDADEQESTLQLLADLANPKPYVPHRHPAGYAHWKARTGHLPVKARF